MLPFNAVLRVAQFMSCYRVRAEKMVKPRSAGFIAMVRRESNPTYSHQDALH